MNAEDIARMAEEAGMMRDENVWFSKNRFHIDVDIADLERFAKLVASAEREACAKVCESQRSVIVESHPARVEFDPNDVALLKCALLIRERGAP